MRRGLVRVRQLWRGLVSFLGSFVRRWQRWNACEVSTTTGALARRLGHSTAASEHAAPAGDCTAPPVSTWHEATADVSCRFYRITCAELCAVRSLFGSCLWWRRGFKTGVAICISVVYTYELCTSSSRDKSTVYVQLIRGTSSNVSKLSPLYKYLCLFETQNLLSVYIYIIRVLGVGVRISRALLKIVY